MTIPSFKILKKNASERLADAPQSQRIVLVYAGIITALAVLVTLVNYALKLQIAQTGGLSNMGLRTILSTIQTMLPMIQSLLVMCLELGYIAAMLRLARQQYASEQTLKLGFDRFWVMLRYSLLLSGIYTLVGFVLFWVTAQIYFITPLSRPVTELLLPVLSEPGFTLDTLMLDEALVSEMMLAMLPLLLIFGVLYLIFVLRISYSLRMARYVIIDKPGRGAIYAIQESRAMMKGNRFRLFQLDLRLWWWYAISAGSMMLCYGDVLLSMAGISLPWSADVSYFVFYALFLAAQFAACFFLRNYIEVIYAQVYNALKPREKETGVVLGNIFQM
ncbi:MAG: DUF975 family protein [Faecousia sp.]